MVARQQNTTPLARMAMIALVAVGYVVSTADSGWGQIAKAPLPYPVYQGTLEGAPPDPDAFILSPDVADVLDKEYPRSVDDLRVIEKQLRRVLERVVPATVGIQIGPSAGSGVIISPDGLVLTAGHVSGEPERDALLIMPDGRRLRARTLGLNRGIDSGLMQITEEGPWPYVEMALSNEIEPGQWVVATGHPGGFNSDRSPPVRLGRVLYANNEVVCTDCTLVGGDSGGPLFNMKGEVIGIHSRIGRSLTSNFHVPIATYRDTWDRLAAGEAWGGRLPTDEQAQVRPYLGMFVDGRGDGLRVTQVSPNTPADRAGVHKDDLIVRFGETEVASREELIKELWASRPGQRIEMEVRRGDETLTLRVVIGGIAHALPGSPDYEPREPRRRSGRDRSEQPERERRRESPQPEPEQKNEPQREESAEEPAQPKEPQEKSVEEAQPPAPKTVPPEPAPETNGKEPAEKPRRLPDEAGSPGGVDLPALGIELDPVALRCVVSRVEQGSVAEAAGLAAGDVIASINGVPTEDTSAAARVLAEAKSTEEVRITVRRGGRELTLVLAPRSR